ncbi:MAG: hypothetical protein H7843_04845 [Nitrospirota bacterium]
MRLSDISAIGLAGRLMKIGLPAVTAAFLILVLLIFTFRLYAVTTALRKIDVRYAEFKNLAAQYYVPKRAGRATGISRQTANTIDEILASMSLKSRLNSVKSAGKRNTMEYVEETAEFKFKDLTVNELINLLYVIEHGTHPLLIKAFKLKKGFEDPDKFELTVDIASVATAEEQGK